MTALVFAPTSAPTRLAGCRQHLGRGRDAHTPKGYWDSPIFSVRLQIAIRLVPCFLASQPSDSVGIMGLFDKFRKPSGESGSTAGAPLPPPPVSNAQVKVQRTSRNTVVARGFGYHSVQVVGESRYLKNISQILGGREGEKITIATIVSEPENKFDKNAIRIDVDGLTVGYIAKEETDIFRPLLAHATSLGCELQASARVWFNGDSSYQIGSVNLDMVEPALALPINSLPSSDEVRLWPEGKSLQLSGEEARLDGIQNLLAKAYHPGACSFFGELVVVNDGKKTLIRIDASGAEIGLMSAVSAKKFLPVIEAVQSKGRRIFVIAQVRGNAVAAEAQILLKSPEMLTTEEVSYLTA